MISFNYSGKVVLVTGAGRGLGLSIAGAFHQAGATVLVNDRTADIVVAAMTALGGGGRLVPAPADLAGEEGPALAVAPALSLGRLDILVNNAGIAHVGTLATTAEADFDRLHRVNTKGVFLCAQAALPAMLAQGGGVILNMASIASLIGIEARFAYSMTKGAVLSMTRSIAVDYVTQKIRCNCICPARIHTPFVDGFLAKNYPGREREMFEQLSAYQPVGRMGTPEEVAQLALYLCSDAASFITGQAFPIDGGVLMK